MTGTEGRDTDGSGTTGAVDEKTREARPGETDTTRFGMADEGAGTDGEGTGGMVDKKDAGGPIGGSGGVASSLQRGGTTPGGGPGTSEGSIGTGGGSNANEDTGNLKRWSDGENQGSRR